MSATVLSCRNLNVGYKAPVLSDINFEIQSGQFVSLLGPNGAGKTTLLRTISRHIPPLSGEITVLGRNVTEISSIDMARIMAVGLTDASRPPLLTVFEYVALGRYPYTGFMGRLTEHDTQIVANSLAAVAGTELAERPVETLSDGERQKAVLARALAQEPKIMLLDEPTAHLDLKHRIEIMGILRNLCRERDLTVISSLHDVDIAAKVSDRVLMVKQGGIMDYGMPEKVLTSEAVVELYDFNDADFCCQLGSIELRSDGSQGRAFVAAGHGTGASIYRLLAKRGMSMATSMNYADDLDAYVARALGGQIYFGDAMAATPAADLVSQISAEIDGCKVVISGVSQVEGDTSLNAIALQVAEQKGVPVFVLGQNKSEPQGNRQHFASLADMNEALSRL